MGQGQEIERRPEGGGSAHLQRTKVSAASTTVRRTIVEARAMLQAIIIIMIGMMDDGGASAIILKFGVGDRCETNGAA